MQRAEFDKFAEEYKSLHLQNIASSGESPEYFAEYKMRDLRQVIDAASNVQVNGSFLDFGAGTGTSVPFFRKHFPSARLTCLDVSGASLEIAASNFGNSAEYVVFDGRIIPFAPNSYDAAYACCVFHHISPQEHIWHMRELRRILKTNGILIVYEHNPLNPLTVRAVNTCPFDEKAILIRASVMKERLKRAGFGSIEISYRVFFPRFLRSMRWMEDWLKWLPLGAQYYVKASKDEE